MPKVMGTSVLLRNVRNVSVKPVVLLILDGWGYREETQDNALAMANLPNWNRLLRDYPHTLIRTEGKSVGLPDGQMGNSEVGHMNLGAGRIVYQDLTRVDAAIEDRSFFSNEALLRACDAVKTSAGTLHLMGLLSPGGVHSHEQHLFALLRLAKEQGVAKVVVHAFLDGRDTPPRSALASLKRLDQVMAEVGNARLGSVVGRYYAMDRDQRWDRVGAAYAAIVDAQADFNAANGVEALSAAYARDENDEFVSPTVIDGAMPMADGDAVVFFNFRADRAREMTAAFTVPAFDGFEARRPNLVNFTGLSEYSAELPAAVAFASDDLRNTLGEVLQDNALRQLRIAETEKYAHVTFFFSGGREAPYHGETRTLIPSPKVATYDMQPEMSCPEVTAKLAAAIRGGEVDVAICNIANPDMVGHTGVLEAAIKAAEAVDVAIGEIAAAVNEVGGALLITADHGNLEMMRDPVTGQPHTAHTVGPVPFVYVGERHATLRSGGALRDVAPTVLDLLGIAKPAEMTGATLLQ